MVAKRSIKRDAEGQFSSVNQSGSKATPSKSRGKKRATKRKGKTPAQIEAAKANLEKARAARSSRAKSGGTKSKLPAGPVKWDGPPIAKPDKASDDAVFGILSAGTFDDYKHGIRIGARNAQQQGYSGPRSDFLRKESKRLEDIDADYEPLVGRRDLEDVGGELFSKMVHSPPTTTPMYRGVGVDPEHVSSFKKGEHFSMPLSSFIDKRESAESYAFPADHTWMSEEQSKRRDFTPVTYKLDSGAKMAGWGKGSEHVTTGEFEVVSVKPYQLKQVYGGRDAETRTAYLVRLRQVSLKEKTTPDDAKRLEDLANEKERKRLDYESKLDEVAPGWRDR